MAQLPEGLYLVFFKDTWGWDGIFIFMEGSVFMAGSLMITKWNALPNDSGGEIKK